MATPYNRIEHGDCIAGMKRLADGSVDLAFADPPFNIGYDYDEYRDKRSCDDYLSWSRDWMAQVIRVLKPDGAFWLAIGDEYAAELKVLATRELGLACRSWVVWFYTFGVHCKQKFTRSHVHLFHLVKDPKKFTFNSLDVRVPSARQIIYGDKRADPDGRVPDDTWMMAPVLPAEVPTRDGFILRPQDIPERFPVHSDTWFFSRVAGTFKERQGFHGCQMPEQLLGRIIRACSNPGEVVLDPFAGSGTTPAVAKKLDRRFLAYELSEEYAAKVRQRLKRITPGDSLDGPEDAARSAPATRNGRTAPQRLMRTKSREPLSSPVRQAASVRQRCRKSDEIAASIAHAFTCAHRGYSADRVLADPALNEVFLDNCRRVGIPGDAKQYNHLLLNVRKQGGLAEVETTRRTICRRSEMEPFIFASEIAWRKVKDDYGCSLDDILCDPGLGQRFERLAAAIVPGYSPFDYRWSALSIRKDASKGSTLLSDVDETFARVIVHPSHFADLHDCPAHYLLTVSDLPFFVGYTESLRNCGLFNHDRLETALDTMSIDASGDADVQLRFRKFDVRAMECAPTNLRAARREKLLLRYDPRANILQCGSAA